jgi:hypothetical protein
MSKQEISFNTKLSEQIKTRADFTYKISPTVVSIFDTGLGHPCGNSNQSLLFLPTAIDN